MRGARVLLAALLAWFAVFGAAAAHTRSETHSNWEINGPRVRGAFTIPDLEAKRLGRDGAPPSDAVLAAYVGAHVGASSGARDCPPTQPTRAVAAAPGYRRFELAFLCPGERAIRLKDSAFFERVPTHVNFAQVETGDGEFVEQLFTEDQQVLSVGEGAENALKSASFRSMLT